MGNIFIAIYIFENTVCHKVLAAYNLGALIETEKYFHFKFLVCRHSEDVTYSSLPSTLPFIPFTVLK